MVRKKLAALFQGQDVGGKQDRLTRSMLDSFVVVQHVFDRVSAALGFNVADLYFSVEEKQVQPTYNAQLFAYLEGVVVWLWMLEHGKINISEIAYILGHSAGQVAGFVAAGVLSIENGARVIHERGTVMGTLAQSQIDEGQKGGMELLLGGRKESLNIRQIKAVCTKYPDVVIGGYNTPNQIMITGLASSVAEVTDESVREGYAERKRPVTTQGAWHSPLMVKAGPLFADKINGIPFENPKIPIVGNTTAHLIQTGEEARQELITAIPSALLWQQSMRFLIHHNVKTFAEINTSELLAGMVPKGRRGRVFWAFAVGTTVVVGGLVVLGGKKYIAWRSNTDEVESRESSE